MSSIPDVSVVIPVYNAAEYLNETLDSVLAQDIGLARIEIVAVDDGSGDRSLEILREYEARFEQVHVFSIPNSGTGAAPRNLGIEQATGRYIFFMDSDDKMEPDTLSSAVGVADRTGNKIVLVKMETFGRTGRKAPQTMFRESHIDEDFIDSLAYRTLGPQKLFDRQLLIDHEIRYPLGYRIGEDQPFVLKAFLNAPVVSVLADKVYYWLRNRDDASNLTAMGQPIRQEMLKVKTYLGVLEESDISGERRDTLLERPLVGNAGLRMIFGKRFMAELNAEERRQTLTEFQRLVSPLMSDAVRRDGTVETQVLADLVVDGDLAALEEISTALAERPHPDLVLAEDRSGLVYRTGAGKEIGNLKLVMAFEFLELNVSLTEIVARAEIGARGARVLPDNVRFLWKHRRTGTEIEATLEFQESYSTPAGERQMIVARASFSAMETPGDWDAFIELTWGEETQRRRFGSSRIKEISTASQVVGSPPRVAVYFTEHGNITVDQGPVRAHPQATSIPDEPEAVITAVGRRRLISIANSPDSVSDIRVTGRGKTAVIHPARTVRSVLLSEMPKWADSVELRDHTGTVLWSKTFPA